MEYFCEKTVEVLEDSIVIHQAGEVARTERKATLDDINRIMARAMMDGPGFYESVDAVGLLRAATGQGM